MRVVGIDLGQRRVGLAVSDHSRTIATPFKTLHVSGDAAAIATAIHRAIGQLEQHDEGIGAIVIGLPLRLDGTEHDRAPWTRAVADKLSAATTIPVVLQDERLTSREAEERLAVRERDWRRRKQKLDAAAAAIVLQDYLDQQKRDAS